MQPITKNLIKRRFFNMLLITIIVFSGFIAYLGLHKVNIESNEKFEVVIITPSQVN